MPCQNVICFDVVNVNQMADFKLLLVLLLLCYNVLYRLGCLNYKCALSEFKPMIGSIVKKSLF